MVVVVHLSLSAVGLGVDVVVSFFYFCFLVSFDLVSEGTSDIQACHCLDQIERDQ